MSRRQVVYKTTERERAYARAYYRTHVEQQRASNVAYRAKHPDLLSEYSRNRNQRLKVEAIYAYGNQCTCCGETELEFLAIDHVNGGGSAHRKEIKKNGTGNFYLWLKDNGFPLGFRVLCHNCNFAIGKYGICPHVKLPSSPPQVGAWHRRDTTGS